MFQISSVDSVLVSARVRNVSRLTSILAPARYVHSDDGRAPAHPPGRALWHLPLHGGHVSDGHPAVRAHHTHGHARQASPRPHLRHQGNTRSRDVCMPSQGLLLVVGRRSQTQQSGDCKQAAFLQPQFERITRLFRPVSA